MSFNRLKSGQRRKNQQRKKQGFISKAINTFIKGRKKKKKPVSKGPIASLKAKHSKALSHMKRNTRGKRELFQSK